MSPSSPASPQAVLDRTLPRLWEDAPEMATLVGCPGFDDRLPEPSREAMERRLGLFATWSEDLGTSAPSNETERLDVATLQARIEVFRFAYEDLGNWLHNPDPFSDLGELLFFASTRQSKSANRQFSDIASRLRAVPAYVEGFRDRLEPPDRLWLGLADQVAASIGSLFDALPASAAAAGADPETVQQVASAVSGAKAIARDHRRWISSLTDAETVEDRWRLGSTAFEDLLERKHLNLNGDEVLAIGREQLALRSEQRNRHPSPSDPAPADFDVVLLQVRDVVARSRAFLGEHRLVDLVPGEELAVEATPAFLRPLIPFAALLNPGPLEATQRSIYLVTEPSDGDLSGLRPSRICGVTVHEGYPGHHVQLTASNRLTSLARARLIGAIPADGAAALGVDLVEGWAHYSEELMLDLGFGDTPEARWNLRNDQVMRAVRILVDCGLCSGRMERSEAEGLLITHAGIAPAAARAEVLRYTMTPAYPLCYLIGKLKLEALRDELKERWGEDFNLRRFHNQILGAGCIPIELLRSSLLPSGDTPVANPNPGLRGQASH